MCRPQYIAIKSVTECYHREFPIETKQISETVKNIQSAVVANNNPSGKHWLVEPSTDNIDYSFGMFLFSKDNIATIKML